MIFLKFIILILFWYIYLKIIHLEFYLFIKTCF